MTLGAAGGGRGGFGMIYEQTSAGAGGSESAVDHSRVEDRCGNKMLFKGGTGGGEGGEEEDEEEEGSILHLSIGLLDPHQLNTIVAARVPGVLRLITKEAI